MIHCDRLIQGQVRVLHQEDPALRRVPLGGTIRSVGIGAGGNVDGLAHERGEINRLRLVRGKAYRTEPQRGERYPQE